jgi:hypothetical protein
MSIVVAAGCAVLLVVAILGGGAGPIALAALATLAWGAIALRG